MSKKKIIIGITGLALVAALSFGGKYWYDFTRYKRIISEVEIMTPDISQVQDGVYNGFFNAYFVSADVEVTVSGHRITDIVIKEHINDRGAGAEVITQDVIIQQSLDVDTISGATNSSKVILKAIETALESGIDTVSGATTGAAN